MGGARGEGRTENERAGREEREVERLALGREGELGRDLKEKGSDGGCVKLGGVELRTVNCSVSRACWQKGACPNLF